MVIDNKIEEILTDVQNDKDLQKVFKEDKKEIIAAQKLLEKKEKFRYIKLSEVEAAIEEWKKRGLGDLQEERKRKCFDKAYDRIQKIFSYLIIFGICVFFFASIYFFIFDKTTLVAFTIFSSILIAVLRFSDIFSPLHVKFTAFEKYLARIYCDKIGN